jgi:hypothetical protein
MYGVEFNDRLLTIASDCAALATSPLRLLGRQPSSAGALAAMLDVLRERLPSATEPRLWAAVPSRFSNADLGELLRMLRAAGYSVEGFVDASTAVVAWLRLHGQTIVLDLGLHARTLSVVSVENEFAQLRRTVQLPGGQAELLDSWLRLAAESLIKQTRFDPLHESQLRARLPGMAVQAQKEGVGRSVIDANGKEFELVLSRDQFVLAAQPWCLPLTHALQALCAGLGDCNVLVPEALLDYPAMVETLAAMQPGRVFAVKDAAARAASLMPTGSEAGGAVPYLTRFGLFSVDAPPDSTRRLDMQSSTSDTLATHLVFQGRAICIPASGLVLGRDPVGGEYQLRLPEGIAGLSRRHCTVQTAKQGTFVLDHSRFGTYVDGIRVNGRRLLVAGSSLRLGFPGIELPLIAMESAS